MAVVWQAVTEIQRLQALEAAPGSIEGSPRTDNETVACLHVTLYLRMRSHRYVDTFHKPRVP